MHFKRNKFIYLQYNQNMNNYEIIDSYWRVDNFSVQCVSVKQIFKTQNIIQNIKNMKYKINSNKY